VLVERAMAGFQLSGQPADWLIGLQGQRRLLSRKGAGQRIIQGSTATPSAETGVSKRHICWWRKEVLSLSDMVPS